MRVLLNAVNCTALGPRAIMESLVPLMATVAVDSRFLAIVPRGCGYENWTPPPNLVLEFVERSGIREWQRLLDIFLRVPTWCRTFGADVCFTLGDVGPLWLPIPQVVLMHRSLLVDDPSAWRAFPWTYRLTLSYLSHHLRWMSRSTARFIVQSPVVQERLAKHCRIGLDRIRVIPQPLPQHMASVDAVPPHPVVSGIEACKLVFVSGYRVHRNHAVIRPLVEEMRRRGLDKRVHIFVTLSCDGDAHCEALLRELSRFPSAVTNLGSIDRNDIAGVYKAADALFLPTLSESLGFPYLEAMATGTPILTSHFEFARWCCRDLATYFDPTSPESIADAIESFLDAGVPTGYRERALERLAEFPAGWEQVVKSYLDVLRESLA